LRLTICELIGLKSFLRSCLFREMIYEFIVAHLVIPIHAVNYAQVKKILAFVRQFAQIFIVAMLSRLQICRSLQRK